MPQIVPAPNLADADVPAARIQVDDKWQALGRADARWHYVNADGSSNFWIFRWDASPAGRKEIRPLAYTDTCTHKKHTGPHWCWVGPAKPRPLLYAPALTARPSCPVLLVEGEKSADAARAYLPPGWEVTTWSGGTNAIKQSDFGILAGHPVIIWPDNDEAGMGAAGDISELLHAAGIQHAIVPLPGLPPKWDLADELPTTLSGDAVAVLLARTLNDLTAPPPVELPAKVNGHHKPEASIDSEIEIVCLGHRNRKFYFIGARSQTVLDLGGKDLQDLKGLRELCPDDNYWYKNYGTSAENFNAGKVGSELIAKCYAAGIYNDGNARGRGCWMDAGRVVFHAGDYLLVDGVRCEPIAIKSNFVYPKLPKFFNLSTPSPLTAEAGRNLQKIVHKLRWQNRDALTADIFTGFLATMMIAGALKFRSHGWVTGASGAGKSYTVSEIAARCVGAMSVIPEGASTEAGIRSQLNSEAFPVLFDEAEGHGPEGEAKRDTIIQMMRISTQNSRGAVLKGSSSHKTHSFRVQSQFLLASIGVGLKEAADLNRCIVMNLDSPASATKQEQEARIAEFQAIDAAVRALPDTLPEQILLRMLPRVLEVRELADRLSTHFMRMLGTSTIKRVGDLLATPLAGMWFLTHDAPPTDERLTQWLERYNFRPWEGANEAQQVDEVADLLRYLADQPVRVEFDHGSGDRTVGSLIAHVAGYDYDRRVTSDECKRVLLQYGMKYDAESRGVWVSTKHDTLDRLMRNNPYGSGYVGILKRHRGVRQCDKPMWMGNKANRALWLPVTVFLGERVVDIEIMSTPPENSVVPPAQALQTEIPGYTFPGEPDLYEPGMEG